MKYLHLRNIQCLARSSAVRSFTCRNTQNFPIQSSHSSIRRSFHASLKRRAVIPYLLADIGEGITECQIISWSVKPGDRVEQFDKICEVQSDKASVEITSRFDGTIRALHYGTDDMAIVGEPLVDIDIDGDVVIPEDLLRSQADREKEAGQPKEAEALMDEDIQRTAGSVEPENIPGIGSELNKILPPLSPTTRPLGKQAVLITPGVRHMLKQHRLDVADIEGTGKHGRVLKEDIQQHMSKKSHSASTNTPVPQSREGDQHVALTPAENQMFKVMTRSLNIPHFLYTHAVDFTTLNTNRRKFNASTTLSSILSGSADSTTKLTPLPFIMKALSFAFLQFPKLNSHLDTETNPNKPQLLIKASHNFSIAIDTPQGLLVPVVRDVQNHSITSLAVEINRLSSLAKNGQLSVDDFKGATFTVSNIGSIGGSAVGPVIVSPMLGIIGVGRARDIPAFKKNEQGVEEIVKIEEVTLSWSADHRIIDGATVAKCAKIVQELLENVEFIRAMLK